MSLFRLCLRNLVYHWRGNSAVALGVAIGTAVLTGALLVGDSLRGSLRDLTLRRLGWVDQALVTPDFFRQEVADGLRSAGAAGHVALGALLLQATAAAAWAADAGASPGPTGPACYGQSASTTVVRLRARATACRLAEGTVDAQRPLAEALGVGPGSKVTLRLQKPSAVPRESLLGRKEAGEVVDDWTLPVGRILGPADAMDHFSLRPGLEAPRDAFVRLADLQSRLGGSRAGSTRSSSATSTPDLAERLTRAADASTTGTSCSARRKNASRRCSPSSTATGTAELTLERVRRSGSPTALVQAIGPGPGRVLTRAAVESFFERKRGYLSLESPRLLLPKVLDDAALAAAKATGLRAAPTLVYLANGISDGKQTIPYSLVAAARPPAAPPPLGWFLLDGIDQLADDQIVLADWKDSPLQAKPGDPITLTYFEPEHAGEPHERTATFRLAGTIPLAGPAADPDLTPEFPGITDKLSIDEWNPPFPFDNKRVKPTDDASWKTYRTAPKAYVTLKAGQKLWGSRFGDITSVRLAPVEGRSPAAAAGGFTHSLAAKPFSPNGAGLFVFDAVKQDALDASSRGTDFSSLFLGFSFFLIAAALLLVGLLFRLNIDRRASEIGLLVAVGYQRKLVRRMLLVEGGFLALLGVLVGTGLAIAYGSALVQFLGAIWPGGALESFLRPHISGMSLIIGAVSSLLVSLLTIAWSVRVLGKAAPVALMAGQTITERDLAGKQQLGWSLWVTIPSLAGGVALVLAGTKMHDQESQAGSFFSGGALLLTAFLAGVLAWMRGSSRGSVRGHGWSGIARLGVRNAARHPARSLLTAGLLATAAFVLVAVEGRFAASFRSQRRGRRFSDGWLCPDRRIRPSSGPGFEQREWSGRNRGAAAAPVS